MCIPMTCRIWLRKTLLLTASHKTKFTPCKQNICSLFHCYFRLRPAQPASWKLPNMYSFFSGYRAIWTIVRWWSAREFTLLGHVTCYRIYVYGTTQYRTVAICVCVSLLKKIAWKRNIVTVNMTQFFIKWTSQNRVTQIRGIKKRFPTSFQLRDAKVLFMRRFRKVIFWRNLF